MERMLDLNTSLHRVSLRSDGDKIWKSTTSSGAQVFHILQHDPDNFRERKCMDNKLNEIENRRADMKYRITRNIVEMLIQHQISPDEWDVIKQEVRTIMWYEALSRKY